MQEQGGLISEEEYVKLRACLRLMRRLASIVKWNIATITMAVRR